MLMRGPCAKRRVVCIINAANGMQFTGENDCANPQPVCPRLPGEGYEKCKTICEQGEHAEVKAINAAGELARGSEAVLHGHYYICEPCESALHAAGVKWLTIMVEK